MAAASDVLAIKESQEALFERGFKAWCENTSVNIRKRMGLDATDPLSPHDLAKQLDVSVWKLDEVPGLDTDILTYLSSKEGDEWSAVTVVVGTKQIILVNPRHSSARQSSDLMHELAHVIKKHDAAQMFVSEGGYALRNFDEKQESEANWFAGTLLLPRTVLADCTYRRKSLQHVLQEYTVSEQLYRYRMRMTGVNRQFGRSY